MKLALLMFLSLTLALVVSFLAKQLSMKAWLDLEKLSPFECGFSPKCNSRTCFSLQFFLVSLIFLIFDVELVLLFPFLVNSFYSLASKEIYIFWLFLVVLSAAYLYEWAQAMLEWKA